VRIAPPFHRSAARRFAGSPRLTWISYNYSTESTRRSYALNWTRSRLPFCAHLYTNHMRFGHRQMLTDFVGDDAWLAESKKG
jgi:hypothetical protein